NEQISVMVRETLMSDGRSVRPVPARDLGAIPQEIQSTSDLVPEIRNNEWKVENLGRRNSHHANGVMHDRLYAVINGGKLRRCAELQTLRELRNELVGQV